jgi:hypothetical protein
MTGLRRLARVKLDGVAETLEPLERLDELAGAVLGAASFEEIRPEDGARHSVAEDVEHDDDDAWAAAWVAFRGLRTERMR